MGSANRGRVAKNTLFLYLRQIQVMVIALYTSRVILEALGVVEYGVYNVVAGVSTTFIFFSIALSTSTQRFLTYSMGKGDDVGLRRVFSQSFWLYITLASAVLVIGLLVGSWIVRDVLVIPPHLVQKALIVFYMMIVSLALTVIAAVFEAVIISRENMKIYAYMGIFDALFKLVVAFVVSAVAEPDRLVTYAVLMVAAMLIPKLWLTLYCLRRYPESRPFKIWDKKLVREMLGFTGWNTYGSFVYILNDNGINVALNMFFGPVVNAARGVAVQVNAAINSLSQNFFIAMRPQLIKNYAEGNMAEERQLMSLASRGSFFMVSCLAIPFMWRMPEILSIWLKDVPAHSVAFVNWTLVFLTTNALNNPIRTVVHATGDIRRSAIEGDTIFLMALPAAVICLLLGFPAWSVYPCLIVIRLISNLSFLKVVRRVIALPPFFYTREVVLPILGATVVSALFGWAMNALFPAGFLGLLGYGLMTFLGCLAADIYLGLNAGERTAMFTAIRKRLARKRS